MQPLYDLKTPDRLDPRVYQLAEKAHHLFPVPRDNAVGTNDFNNAITLIRFRKNRVVYDEIARDFFKYVSGGELSFMPVFDNNVIGYGQTRRFVRVDLKTSQVREHRICYPLEETIQKIALSDNSKEHYIFQIEKFAKDTVDTSNYKTLLRLMDLSGKEPVLLRERELPQTVKWFTAYHKVFLYSNKMAAYTSRLEPSDHPMGESYNKNVKSAAWRTYAHPVLPFAVIAVNAEAHILLWGKKDENNYMNLLKDKAIYFDFAPDAKWVVFQKKFMGDATFYLMPVSEKLPHYLGSPILLYEGNFLATCWTTNPISFVGSTGSRLRRWELTSQAYPQAGRMDLHDYFVQRDLEKLKAQEGAK